VAAHLEALREMGVPERAGVREIGLPPEMKHIYKTFHKQQGPLYRSKPSPDISSPRRLGVKGTDTEPLSGCRLGSGETGIQVPDGFAEDGPSANEARPANSYTTAGLAVQKLPDLQRVLFAADQIQQANEAMRDKDIDHQPLVLQIWQLDWAAEMHMELMK